MTKPAPRNDSVRFTMLLATLLSLSTIVVGGLALQTWRTARAHRASAEGVLADYASFAAWSYGSRVRSAVFLAVNPIFTGADRGPQQVAPVLAGMRAAADSIAECSCGTDLAPEFVFLIDLNSGREFVLRRDSSVDESEAATRTKEIGQSASELLARGGHSRAPGTLPYRWTTGGRGDNGWIAFYAVRFRSADDRGVIVGFESPNESFASAILATALKYGSLLPQSLTRTTPQDSLLSVVVSARDGNPIYTSAASFASTFSAAEALGPVDSTVTATVTMNPDVASRLVIGGLPASPLRTVFPLVSLAIAMLVVAFYLVRRREVQSLEVRARLSEANLSALRTQLQPHFLFNVLNSISMLARKGDSKAVVQSVTQLGELLRRLLHDSPTELVELREEIEFIEQYLALERIRFQDLRTTIEIPAELRSALVPRLILQPLVENALRHGAGQLERDGAIRINARREIDSLILTVTDNGPGFGTDEPIDGIGLHNSRERLAQIYGNAALLEIKSIDGEGVASSVSLPFDDRSDV